MSIFEPIEHEVLDLSLLPDIRVALTNIYTGSLCTQPLAGNQWRRPAHTAVFQRITTGSRQVDNTFGTLVRHY